MEIIWSIWTRDGGYSEHPNFKARCENHLAIWTSKLGMVYLIFKARYENHLVHLNLKLKVEIINWFKFELFKARYGAHSAFELQISVRKSYDSNHKLQSSQWKSRSNKLWCSNEPNDFRTELNFKAWYGGHQSIWTSKLGSVRITFGHLNFKARNRNHLIYLNFKGRNIN